MFDALKTMALGGETPEAKAASTELIKLIRVAREQKTMLEAALNQVDTRKDGLLQTAKSLERVEKRAMAAGGRLDDLDEQVSTLTTLARSVDQVSLKVDLVTTKAQEAEQLIGRLIAPDGELQNHREALQSLDGQAAEYRASIEALKTDRSVVEEVRQSLRDAQGASARSSDQLARLTTEIENLHTQTPQLTQEFARLKETAREEREYADTVMKAVTDIEKKIGALTSLDELSKTTEERLATLNSLAEHVSMKVKSLEGQRVVVERALVESHRLNGMVFEMDAQVARLSEGGNQIVRTEELLERLEKLSTETGAQLEAGGKAKDELVREIANMQHDSKDFAEFARAYLEKVGLARQESDSLEQRLSTLHAGMSEAESRLDLAATKDRSLAGLGQRIDAMTQRVEKLAEQGDDLATKHEALKPLHERLSLIEELSTRTTSQMDNLARSRQDLEALRVEFQDVSNMSVEIGKSRDMLTADRAAMEASATRLTAFHATTPEIEGKLDVVLSRLNGIDQAAEKAARLAEDSVSLDQQLTRLNARAEFVDMVHGRVDELSSLTTQLDRQLEVQLMRKSELEQMKAVADGVAVQVVDVVQQVNALSERQGQLVPLKRQVAALEKQVAKTAEGVRSAQLEEGALAAQEKRLVALADQGRTLSGEVANRLRQVHGLTEELKRAVVAKDEMSAELGEMQGRQREVALAVEASDGQIKRVGTLLEQLETRRTQLLFMEKKIGAFETKVDELKQGTAAVDQQIAAVASQEQVIGKVKAQADGVKDIAAKTKADLDHVLAHRGDINALKDKIDGLLASASEADEKIRLVEDRKTLVDTVHTETTSIVNMMGDVRVTLETLTEHSAVVDAMSDKVSKLDFAVHQAQNTLSLLQRERELAEQIDRGLRQLRRKRDNEDEARKTA